MTTPVVTTPTVDERDAADLAELRRVARQGAALIGPHERVCAIDTTRSAARPSAVEMPRTQQDAVQRLFAAGLLGLAGRYVIDDHGHDRQAHDVIVTPRGQRLLDQHDHTGRTPTP